MDVSTTPVELQAWVGSRQQAFLEQVHFILQNLDVLL